MMIPKSTIALFLLVMVGAFAAGCFILGADPADFTNLVGANNPRFSPVDGLAMALFVVFVNRCLLRRPSEAFN